MRGKLDIAAVGGPFTITAKADRIDRLVEGGFLLVDYKTGSVPQAKQVQTGFAPQLPLEGAILRSGGFKGVSGSAAALEYWRLSGGEPAGERCPIDADDPGALIDRVVARVEALIERFDDPATPYLAVPVAALGAALFRLPAPRAARRERGRGMRSFGDPDTRAAQGCRPAGFSMGLRLGRNRQDAGADRPLAVADARRDRSRTDPVPDLYPRRCRRDGQPAERGAGQLGDLEVGGARETLQKLTGRMPERRDDLAALGSSSPEFSTPRAASRSPRSMPFAKRCCAASRWRRECLPNSRCSTSAAPARR